MYQKPAYADDVAGVQYPQRSVPEQHSAQTSFLKSSVDGKPCENGHRDRVRHVAPESSSRFRAGERASRKCIIGNDTICFANDKRS